MIAGGMRAGWIEAAWPVAGEARALTTSRDTDAFAGTGLDAADGEPVPVSDSAAGREWLKDATVGACGNLQWLRQVHGNRCVRATFDSCSTVPEADAVWTDATGLGLVVQTADCVPVAIADPKVGRIGVAHGGWRGLAAGVVAGLVDAMGPSSGLVAWIGPAIGRDHYEVGEDVRSTMRTAFGDAVTGAVFTPGVQPGKWQLDLYGLTARLLTAAGVGQIGGARLCTFSDPRFHSYRRDGTAGRMATVVWKTSNFVDMSAHKPKNSPLFSYPGQ